MEQVVKLCEELFLLEEHAGRLVNAVACDLHDVYQSVATYRLVNDLVKVVNLLKGLLTLLPALGMVAHAHFFAIEIRTKFIQILGRLQLVINEFICTVVCY